jgi:hypothetical protein
LDTLKSVNVVEGYVLRMSLIGALMMLDLDRQPANHPYHFSQLLIILNQFDILFQFFAEKLQCGMYKNETFE